MNLSTPNRRVIAGAVVILGSLGIVAVAQNTGRDDPPDRRARPSDVSNNNFHPHGLGGSVRPSKEVIIKAPLDGIIRSVLVDESDQVEQGQVMAMMDDAMQKIVVEQQRLEAESQTVIKLAKLRRDDAQITYENILDLKERKSATEFEVRRTKLALEQMVAELERAEETQVIAGKSLDLEQEKLNRYQLKAPFAGHIVRVIAEAGATLTREDTVLSLVALDPLEARLFLPLDLYGKIEVGKRYRLDAAAPLDRPITGTLKTISPVLDTASSTVQCVFTIENPGSKLPAGFKVFFMGAE
ncbi:MAG: hypothetical protein CMJ49_06910 [Planctomycetaceae bacterium]|nr:hypothetical protein [Planctomycetaceae bacterium]